MFDTLYQIKNKLYNILYSCGCKNIRRLTLMRGFIKFLGNSCIPSRINNLTIALVKSIQFKGNYIILYIMLDKSNYNNEEIHV